MFARQVFYLAGFDPRGGRFYHQFLADQVAEAVAGGVADAGLTVSDPRRAGRDVVWEVGDGASFTARHHFLAWDDIVRAHWPKGPVQVAWHTARAYGGFLRGLDRGLLRTWPKGSRIALFYPGAALFALPVVLGLGLLAVLAGVMALLAHLGLPTLAVAGAGLIGLALGFWGAVRLGAAFLLRIHAMWMLRFVIFNDLLARQGAGAALEARLDAFAAAVGDAIAAAGPDEEVLLVTHSNGSVLAVPLIVRLLDRFGGVLPARFALVTLGSCIPLVGARRDAGWFHALLDRIGAGGFRWIDITSPTDGACGPGVPPCQGRAVAQPAALRRFSPRWFRYADPATYKARRADKYNTHFDYLRRLARVSPLDYLSLTCSARTLEDCIAAFEAENG